MQRSIGLGIWISLLLTAALASAGGAGSVERDPELSFDDSPAWRGLEHPDWFKHSFLNLGEDLAEALIGGKRGLIVYFGQEHCAYCQAFFENNLGQADIEAYLRAHFDVVPIDIFGDNTVTTLDGDELTEREFAIFEGTNFTPSLIFYDTLGKQVLRLRGYYPPYQFRAALEFVADGHYKSATFAEYLSRGEDAMHFEEGDLNPFELAMPPPIALDRHRFPADRPLMVLYEQGDCHACDILHAETLQETAVDKRLRQLDIARLDTRSDQPIITPTGERTTASKWANELGLFYTPTLLFFDEQGKEIIRVDSVVQFYRLVGVLDFVLKRGYQQEPTFQRWRFKQRREKWKREHGSDLL